MVKGHKGMSNISDHWCSAMEFKCQVMPPYEATIWLVFNPDEPTEQPSVYFDADIAAFEANSVRPELRVVKAHVKEIAE